MGVSARDLTRIPLDNNHTAYMHVCLQGIGRVCVKNYPPEMMQPSSSTSATIVSAKNQNDATIVKDTFFFCHYYIVWESNNAGDARGQSWNESLKSIWIPGGSCGYTSGTKRKHFAALSSPRPWWRWLQLQPSCGSPKWCPWYDVKVLSYQYGKSHCGDKMVVRSCYLHDKMYYTGKMVSLYWIGPRLFCTKLCLNILAHCGSVAGWVLRALWFI